MCLSDTSGICVFLVDSLVPEIPSGYADYNLYRRKSQLNQLNDPHGIVVESGLSLI